MRLKGINLPPGGLSLAILLCLYLFVGLIGHDPWKHDDALSIGVAFDLWKSGDWFIPRLAGEPYPDAPLYYWLAAGFNSAFSWLLSAHEASRLTSGLSALLALEFILQAAREWYGKEFAAVAPITLAGSIGFLFHAHEAQPMLMALMAHAAVYWTLALMPRRPVLASIVLGLALSTVFLADGLLPLIVLVPPLVFSLCFSERRARVFWGIVVGLGLSAGVCALWLFPLYTEAPSFFVLLARSELQRVGQVSPQPFLDGARYLKILLWYAWPALPLAAWALWARRRVLGTKPFALPLFSLMAVLVLLSVFVTRRSSSALLFLPPLVLLAVPGVASLRRGAASAFDWFSMLMFTFLAAVAWIVWSALVFGWPERLARQAVRLEPGFVGNFDGAAALFGAVLTAVWFYLIFTTPRSPMRGIMHWMAGLTLFWSLVAALWMPWIDYGKSYRPVAAALQKAIPERYESRKTPPKNQECIANANLPKSLLAMLDYFSGIKTRPVKSEAGSVCRLLLVHGKAYGSDDMALMGWKMLWEGKRPSDRNDRDMIRLYQRGRRGKSADALPDIDEIEPSQDAASGGAP